MTACPFIGPIGPLPVVSQTRCQPSNIAHFSVPVILPPGPIGDGSTVASIFQLPAKCARFSCSGPGFIAVGAWAATAHVQSAATVQVASHFLMLSLLKLFGMRRSLLSGFHLFPLFGVLLHIVARDDVHA